MCIRDRIHVDADKFTAFILKLEGREGCVGRDQIGLARIRTSGGCIAGSAGRSGLLWGGAAAGGERSGRRAGQRQGKKLFYGFHCVYLL